MSNSCQDTNIEKRLIQGILIPSDSHTNLQKITKIIAEYFSSDFCLILSNFDNLKYFHFSRYSQDNNPKISEKNILQLIENSWIKTIKNKSKIKSISDLKRKGNQLSLDYFEEININSLLAISTSFKGEVNGLILLGKTKSYQWNQREKKILKEIADIVALASHLSQVEMINDEKVQNKDASFSLSNIPKLLEENPILRLWWETTRKQLERQLEWNRKLIYNMITIMSDQTRNPLAIIKMGIAVLRTRELASEEFIKRLAMLEEAWVKLNDINEKILQLKHLKSQNLQLNINSINLQNFIEKITNFYQSKWQENPRNCLNLTIDFNVKPEQIIDTDTKHLSNILEELLTNAAKFSIPNSTVNLQITQENDSHQSQIIMTLSNISISVSEDNINDFFEPFYREQIVIDTAIPGIGVGLSIVKDLVELLRGKITVDCLPTDNPKHCKIVFRLVLPQSLSS